MVVDPEGESDQVIDAEQDPNILTVPQAEELDGPAR